MCVLSQFQDIPAWNIRSFKHEDGHYEMRLASSEKSDSSGLACLGNSEFKAEDGNTYQFSVTCGDYAPLMALTCEYLKKAKVVLLNPNR